MSQHTSKRPKIIFLFSDTGGGHRSAAEAIIESIHLEYGVQIQTEMIDVIKNYTPLPLNRMPELYPSFVRLPRAWELGFHLSNGRHRVRLLYSGAWPIVRKSFRQFVFQNPCDLLVSVHPLLSAPVLRAMGTKKHPPLVTVVTDMATAHASWYHRDTDLCIVASQEAYQRALRAGLQPEQVVEIGLPVANRFCYPPGDKVELRQKWGWPVDKTLVLLVGGGEGMGPIEHTAHAINAECKDAALVVVAGRNQRLKERLQAYSWSIPTFIYGFVREMPDFMRAADILVSKAGPGTITEALIAGLPIILYSRLPGQEDGNVSFVVSEGAGLWAPRSNQIVLAINRWIEFPDERARVAATCLRLARPHASRDIAHLLAARVGLSQPIEEMNPSTV